jgi:hypothetical protein
MMSVTLPVGNDCAAKGTGTTCVVFVCSIVVRFDVLMI